MKLSESAVDDTLEPKPDYIEARAAANLRYIRETMQAAHAFTLVPGRGCIIMGVIAIIAAGLELHPALSMQWLPLWLVAAVLAGVVAVYEMAEKARGEGISLRRSSATRFFMTLAPAFSVGAILTAALSGDVSREVIAGIWLLSYGAGIAACGVFSIPVVLIAGAAFIGLGSVALTAPESWAPLLLAIGFGGIHIALGTIVIHRYDS